MKASDIVILDYQTTCAAGTGNTALRQAIAQQQSGLRKNDMVNVELNTWIGRVPEIDDVQWTEPQVGWKSRNNALIQLALNQGNFMQSIERVKREFSRERVGLIMGSSTSSIDRAEEAYGQLEDDQHLPHAFQQEYVLNPHAPALYAAHVCGISGPAITINTACSSSAKVFASAARWLNLGLVDAVVVGGADTLCMSVLYGFHSLQLVSEKPCKPFDEQRDGINLGEAAGFAILTRKENSPEHTGIKLSGFGESSDAHHMSHPHPDGLGAKKAIEQALQGAALTTDDIDYINLHGTASRANDHIEGSLIANMFSQNTVASSTKGWMGHTLGAAGIIEAIIALDTLHTSVLPGTLNLEQVDQSIGLAMSPHNQQRKVRHVMSNSFGFGGNNCCLLFSNMH
ncbi:beta-ketoacyl-ACP synthase [Agarilytica rhodophyticola]|uniref:beta-ketoacyl-ACP synthase n=1 Tax=Agarilytica rhodophyticola TaxID=1737490 RepID=UPI000B345C25|nr:beta-ketoacyl-ACP synthase [Agarilytica rhodophyticola]